MRSVDSARVVILCNNALEPWTSGHEDPAALGAESLRREDSFVCVVLSFWAVARAET